MNAPLCDMQVPKRIYSLDELRLNKIEAEKFLSPTDNTLSSVRTILQVCVYLVFLVQSIKIASPVSLNMSLNSELLLVREEGFSR